MTNEFQEWLGRTTVPLRLILQVSVCRGFDYIASRLAGILLQLCNLQFARVAKRETDGGLPPQSKVDVLDELIHCPS